ncbi:MAG: PAS domain S-box protein [Rhodospirillales bacterium]|nr:PAS domain S-box protein [Rhodospirillales bacterium]
METGPVLSSSFDPYLVILSIIIICFGTFVTLQLASHRQTAESHLQKLAWGVAAAGTIGASMWAMHFIGMLALKLPIPVSYELLGTLFSMVMAMISGSFVVYAFASNKQKITEILVKAGLLVLSAELMHLSGMAAMEINAASLYDPYHFASAIAVSFGLAGAAIYIWQRSEHVRAAGFFRKEKLWVVLATGSAFAGLHYASLFALNFVALEEAVIEPVPAGSMILAVAVSAVVLIIIVTALISSLVGRRLEILAALEKEITERTKIEQVLNSSEQQFRALVESVPAAILIRDLQGYSLYANKTFGDWHGVGQDALIGKTLDHIVPPELLAEFEAKEREVKESRGIVQIERRVSYKDGTVRNVLDQKFPIFEADGSFIAIGTILNDITQISQAKAQLLRNEKQFADFFEVSSDWFWEMDANLRVIWLSDNFESINGVPREGFYGKTREEFTGAEHDRVTWDSHIESLNNRLPFKNFEYARGGLSGGTRWIRASGVPIFDPDGTFSGYRGKATDVTDIKRTDQRRQELERLFTTFIEHLPMAVIIKDSEFRCLHANSCWHQWHNPDNVPIIGKVLDDFVPPAFAEAVRLQETLVFTELKPVESEQMTFTSNGQALTTSFITFPILDQTDNVIAVGNINIDISLRKQMEEDLRLALIKAEEANQSKSQFLATMSHELRTPLNAIIGFSEMLVGQYFGQLGNDKYKEYAFDILGSGEHLLALINDVLDISAIEIGEQEIQPEFLDLAGLLAECLKMVEQMAEKKNVRVTINNQEALPKIKADATTLKQVVLNLVNNAVRYSNPDGEVIVSSAMEAGGVVIRVSDNGVGIDDKLIHRVTEPFVKGQTDVSIAHDGVGLGLYIVKQIVSAHRGYLEIESEKGKGTVVTVRLPQQ